MFNGETLYECIKYPNYFISKSGDLFSIYVKGARGIVDESAPRKLKYGLDKDGYYRVVLSVGGKHTYTKVHTLMAEQFLGGVLKGMCVNHIDGVKTNNSISNLEVVSFKRNTQHAWETGLNKVEQIPWSVKVDVLFNGKITRCSSISECCRIFSDITYSYLKHLYTGYVCTHDLFFSHVGGKYDYKVEVYRNSKLFKVFLSNEDAASYFGVKKNTISGLCYRNTAGKVFNQYYITFPNVSTIENT